MTLLLCEYMFFMRLQADKRDKSVGYEWPDHKTRCFIELLNKIRGFGMIVDHWSCDRYQGELPDSPRDDVEWINGTEQAAMAHFSIYQFGFVKKNEWYVANIEKAFGEAGFGNKLRCMPWTAGPHSRDEFLEQLHEERIWQDRNGWPQCREQRCPAIYGR